MKGNTMDLGLTDKVAVVTGGSRGIGKAVARQLAHEGVDVALVARGKETLDATAKELHDETGRRFITIVADTGEDADVKHMAEEAAAAFGHIDILVNSAAQPGGFTANPKLADITNEHFFSDMNIKVMGYLRCCREVAPYMQRQGWGRIINISGLAARQSSGSPIGSMRNVALVALTKNLADDLGPYGINVTVIHPGLVKTERWADRMALMSRQQNISEAEVEMRMAQGNSIQRIIDADDIASIVTFLASPRSVAITGDVIPAGGGAGRAIYY